MSNNPVRPLQLRPVILTARSPAVANNVAIRPGSHVNLTQVLALPDSLPSSSNLFGPQPASKRKVLSSQIRAFPMVPPEKLAKQVEPNVLSDEKKFVCRSCSFPIEFPTLEGYNKHMNLVHLYNPSVLQAQGLRLYSERDPSVIVVGPQPLSRGPPAPQPLSISWPRPVRPVYRRPNSRKIRTRSKRIKGPFQGGFGCVAPKCHRLHFETAHELYLHVLGDHHDDVFNCRACFALFTNSSDFETHVSQEHVNDPLLPSSNGDRSISCSQCEASFPDLATLRRHNIVAHTRNRVYFNKDDEKADSKYYKPVENLPFKCLVCQRTMPGMKSLWTHIVGHDEFRRHREKYWRLVGAEGPKGKVRKLFRCYSCQMTLLGKTAYLCHLCHRHGVTLPKTYRLSNHHERFMKRTQCQRCGRVVPSNFSLFLHSRKHLHTFKPKLVFNCRFCSLSFFRISRLWRHLNVIHGFERCSRQKKPYRCSFCERCFARKASLDFHRKAHLNRKRSKRPVKGLKNATGEGGRTGCFFCSRSFSKPRPLWMHLRVHPEFPAKRDEIWQRFVAVQEQNNPAVKLEYYLCDICSIFSDSLPSFLRHKKVIHGPQASRSKRRRTVKHDKSVSFQCLFCSRSFQSLGDLWRHIVDHTQKKKHRDDWWLQVGTENLKPGERFLRCYMCKITFAKRASIRKHLGMVHKITFKELSSVTSVWWGTLALRWKCRRCGRNFGSLPSLFLHSKSHETKKKHTRCAFPCRFCSQSFSRITKLWCHLKTHSGFAQNPIQHQYGCHLCERSFSRWASLSFHLKSHQVRLGNRRRNKSADAKNATLSRQLRRVQDPSPDVLNPVSNSSTHTNSNSQANVVNLCPLVRPVWLNSQEVRLKNQNRHLHTNSRN